MVLLYGDAWVLNQDAYAGAAARGANAAQGFQSFGGVEQGGVEIAGVDADFAAG